MVRLTDRPDMTLDVYHGCKTTIQQYNLDFKIKSCFSQQLSSHLEPNFSYESLWVHGNENLYK